MYLTKQALKNRGWTDSLVKGFLPAPDLAKPNPHFKSAAPVQLYLEERVKQTELRCDFVAKRAKAQVLSFERKHDAKKRQELLVDETKGLPIEVPDVDLKELREFVRSERITDDPPEPFMIDRWCVNWLRHNTPGYDFKNYERKGKVGVKAAHRVHKNRILDTIAAKYPELRNACSVQEVW